MDSYSAYASHNLDSPNCGVRYYSNYITNCESNGFDCKDAKIRPTFKILLSKRRRMGSPGARTWKTAIKNVARNLSKATGYLLKSK